MRFKRKHLVYKNKIYNTVIRKTDSSSLENKKLLICVSGGIDSIFLYHNILMLQSKYNFKIGLAHVNYNTSSESNDSMELCRELSKLNNHPFYLKVYDKVIGSNFEHLAREFRYSFFHSIKKKEKYDYILTAHNQDDLIETMYMQKQNFDNFSILPYSSSKNYILRPLININRQEITDYIKTNDYLYYNDPTNLDSKYKRNDIRMNIFPKLKNRDELFKKLLDGYNLKAKKYNQFYSDYKGKKDKFIIYNSSLNMIKIDYRYIKSLTPYSFKLIFQGIINDKFNIQINKTEKYWEELYRQLMLSNKNISFNVNNFLSVYSNSEYLYINLINYKRYSKRINHNVKWINGEFVISKGEKNIDKDLDNKNVFICSEKVYEKGLFVRRWFNGDKILTSSNQSKLISDLFNEFKLLPFIKPIKPIIVQNDIIEWVPGIAIRKNNYLANKNLIRIEWYEIRK